jgi:hypothetical protein
MVVQGSDDSEATDDNWIKNKKTADHIFTHGSGSKLRVQC